MAFTLQEFKRKRATRRVCGALLFWVGLLALLADMTTSFPTPVRGQYTLWWLVVVAFGMYVWISSQRLPLEEVIEVAKAPMYFGELRVTEVTSEFNVSLETAERILMTLVKKGYARMEQRGETCVWVFPEVKAAGPTVKRVEQNKS